MKKIIFIIIALLTFQLVLAAQGCFLNKDSPLYCQTINQIEAEEECTIIEECNLTDDFVLNQDCSNNNKCKKIFCKSSCTEKFKKDCPAGEISKDEMLVWCSSGCCRFNYLNKNFCQYKTSKWLCEVEVINKHVESFNYELKLDETQCQTFCQKDVNERKKETKLANLDKVTSKIKVSEKKELTKEKDPEEESEDSNNLLLMLTIFILIALAIFYFLHKRRSDPEPPFSEKLEKKWSHLLVPKKTSEKRIKQMQEKHQQSVKRKRREQFLLESGLPLDKKGDGEVDKLNKLVRIHKKVKEKLTRDKPWTDLNKVIDGKDLPEKNEDEAIEKLRKIGK